MYRTGNWKQLGRKWSGKEMWFWGSSKKHRMKAGVCLAHMEHSVVACANCVCVDWWRQRWRSRRPEESNLALLWRLGRFIFSAENYLWIVCKGCLHFWNTPRFRLFYIFSWESLSVLTATWWPVVECLMSQLLMLIGCMRLMYREGPHNGQRKRNDAQCRRSR